MNRHDLINDSINSKLEYQTNNEEVYEYHIDFGDWWITFYTEEEIIFQYPYKGENHFYKGCKIQVEVDDDYTDEYLFNPEFQIRNNMSFDFYNDNVVMINIPTPEPYYLKGIINKKQIELSLKAKTKFLIEEVNKLVKETTRHLMNMVHYDDPVEDDDVYTVDDIMDYTPNELIEFLKEKTKIYVS